VDLRMRMDWRRGRSTISDGAGRPVEENEASGVLESKKSIPAEWSVWIGRIWGGVFKVLGTWDDKLLESSEKKSIQIRLDIVKLWVVDGI
jgi:hypothetical protein